MVNLYLSELLYEHNCVVVPGFGGFITNRLPSKVNEIQQRVEPARKVIVFNINLVQNDGLLASHISQKLSNSFDKANESINEFVNNLKTELALKKHSTLNGIGDFYLNTENKLVFIPEADINFAKETFGLFPITIRRIEREKEKIKIAEKVPARNLPLPFNNTRVKTNRRWIYGSLLIALPILLGVFTQQSGILQKADFNINTIFNNNRPNISEDKISPPTPELKITTTPVPLQLPEAKESKSTEPTPDNKSEPVPVNTTNAPGAVANAQYHIIGGSFAVPANATNFIRLLQTKGYKAYLAGTNPGGLAMISYAGFANETEALQFLQKIQQTENSQAWLLNK